jgi:hypothetical protein
MAEKVEHALSKVVVDLSQDVIAGIANPVLTSWQVPPVEKCRRNWSVLDAANG